MKFTLPVLCALLVLALVSPTGEAHQQPAPIAKPAIVRPLVQLPTPQRQQVLVQRPTARAVVMEVTGYCPCKKCCGPKAQGITASGKHVSYNNGKFVAADTSIIPFGTKIVIPGYAQTRPVEVQDRGGAIKGRKLDLFFKSHQEALNWGRQKVEVIVIGN